MKSTTFVFLIVAVWAIVSCRTETQLNTLAKAQDFMDSHPDSALCVLENEVNKQQLTEGGHALWGLLITKAKAKCHIKQLSDSIINRVLDYYEKSGNKEFLMEAYYYAGTVHHDMNNVLKAQDYYLKALELSNDVRDCTILSRLCYNIGDLYLHQDVHDQALHYQKKALHYAYVHSDSAAISYALRDIARSFTIQNKLDSALHYYNDALIHARGTNKIHIYNELGIIYKKQQDYLASYNYLQQALALIPEGAKDNYSAISSNLGLTYLNMNKPDSALYFLQKGASSKKLSTKANAHYYLYKLYKQTGDKERALLYLEESKLLLDSIDRSKRTNDLQRMQTLYNYHQSEKQILMLETARTQSESSKYRAWLIAVISGVFGVALVFVSIRIWKELKRKREEFKNQLNKQHRDAQATIENNIVQIKKMEDVIKQLQGENKELNEYLENKRMLATKLEATEIFQKLHNIVDDIKTHKPITLTTDDEKELIKTVEDFCPDFALRIRQRSTKLNITDWYLCYLYKINITAPNVLAVFLNLAPNSVISKRDRLHEKIFGKKGDHKDLEEFIRSL
ncbi:lipopolysaccharide assembly protein LapB [Bacteroides sp. 519]|uniref:tetratricopeptide repeat protein n=1 Tax=Bacteroides sp. 519 TaxID=2302937 RepID=UPI0013D5DC55|nr:tetratricopeptide repeat protein [Bacteroides sp. 519]NDV59268.1 hypothetical protein [Bacteroides sp. 519]